MSSTIANIFMENYLNNYINVDTDNNTTAVALLSLFAFSRYTKRYTFLADAENLLILSRFLSKNIGKKVRVP